MGPLAIKAFCEKMFAAQEIARDRVGIARSA
jgi:hypothetical protein